MKEPLHSRFAQLDHCVPLAMWDFSWLERRWSGAGYEDWDRALEGLVERGYEAVRIDCFPHLLGTDHSNEVELLPVWDQNDWGSPAPLRVQVRPALMEFLQACKRHGVYTFLSTWFRDDVDHQRMNIASPADHAQLFLDLVKEFEEAGLTDELLLVDFCNEWPLKIWAPFFNGGGSIRWDDDVSVAWMEQVCSLFKARFPEIPVCFSWGSHVRLQASQPSVSSFLDLLEPHIWMAQANESEFNQKVNYNYEKFDATGYRNLSKLAEGAYRSDPNYWKERFDHHLDLIVSELEPFGLPLVTSEGWSLVDYKDWPGLEWNWIKEINEHAIQQALGKGLWLGMCTSNFCGPQFAGMWDDIGWHQEWTAEVKRHPLPHG